MRRDGRLAPVPHPLDGRPTILPPAGGPPARRPWSIHFPRHAPTPRAHPMDRRPAARRPLLLELLEDRSVPTTAAFSAGILTVTGTAADDVITVRRVGGTITVDGTGAAVAAAQVKQLVVNAGAGNDTIRLNSQDTAGQQALGV